MLRKSILKNVKKARKLNGFELLFLTADLVLANLELSFEFGDSLIYQREFIEWRRNQNENY